MLNELKQIGIYAKNKFDEIENFVIVPSGKFYIFPIIFDGEKLSFNPLFVKEGEKDDLLKMGFKPPKGRVQAILPNVYISLDKNGNVNIKAFKESLEKFVVVFPQFERILELLEDFNLEQIKEKLKDIPTKDENKKIITNILALAVSKDFVKSNNWTVKEDKDFYFLAEIEEIRNYFLAKNKGETAKFEKGFCAICEQEKDNIINFSKSKGINFDYKFYNIDKPGFVSEFKQNEAWKYFGVCADCYSLIKTGYNFFAKKLYKNVLGEKAFIFSSIFFANEEKINKIYDIFEKYDEKQLNKIEQEIVNQAKQVENDFLVNLFNFSSNEEKQELINTNFIRFNFLFGSIDASKSDELKIKYFLKDVLPSQVARYYNSLSKFDKKDVIKKYFPQNASENLIQSLSNLDMIKLREFFIMKEDESFSKKSGKEKKEKNENYYTFLNTVLHGEKLDENWIWALVYEKLKHDFKTAYLQGKNNFLFKLYEAILVIEYLQANNYLDFNFKIMENLQFNLDDRKIKNLEAYFKQNDVFTNYDAVYVALIGLYVRLLLDLQRKELGTNPFITEVDFENLTYEKLEKLLLKARNKFNKYSAKKFEYHPKLFQTILETSMKIKKDLEPEKIAYYLAIGMELLKDVYYASEEN